MTDVQRTEQEWFEDIVTWSPTSVRTARWAMVGFVALLVSAPLLWLLAPPAPSGLKAPLPAWNTKEFADGDTMRKVERHFKETSWVTFAMRGVHDELRRLAGIPPAAGLLGQFDYETSSGELLSPSQMGIARERGFVVPVPWPTPRPRTMIAPNQTFWLCYRDNAVLHRDWFDAKGRVKVRINQYGMRERQDLLEAKPAGQQRVLVLGDSLAFGWGVPEELGSVRLVEEELRRDGRDVRTLNCGGTMAVCADEYWSALEHRFGAFGPDVVVVTLCLNDLVPSNGLCLLDASQASGQRFSDVLSGTAPRSPLDLDPAQDWVGELLKLPKAAGEAGGLYHHDQPFEAMWSQGVPQASLRAMQAWCAARNVGFMVTLWPFLQGLGPGRTYPFQRLHDLVAAQCQADGIHLLDLLPLLRDTPQEDLWVTPADMHPNPKAHRLVAPAMAQAVASQLQR